MKTRTKTADREKKGTRKKKDGRINRHVLMKKLIVQHNRKSKNQSMTKKTGKNDQKDKRKQTSKSKGKN